MATHSDRLDAERAAYVDRLEKAVEGLPERLARIPWVLRARVFGSWARGRRDLLTDLDLLLEVETDLPFVERCAVLHQQLPMGVDADIVAYTPAELDRLQHSSFVRRALSEGKVIYEKVSD